MKKLLILTMLIAGFAHADDSEQRINDLTKMLSGGSYSEQSDIDTTKRSVSQEDIDYCVNISSFAEVAMKHRQNGKKFEEMYRIDLGNDVLNKVAKAAVVDAFKVPLFKSAADKQNAVIKFKDAAIKGCILEFEKNL
ncbi:hypothetical protein [Acinetobacter sp. YH12029]|uniref:hypothetical protein n=1 Tax=Acinetobacter sp. YH12029 TaxID=2601044 RepID=UPI0015D286EC|nr:hypothetical protein [Acinetobacter sp. YH12029]